MSHIIYQTEAVILRTEERGEASRLFWLFTEQFGLVVAHAQSVRAGHSKLKHQLQLYNLVKVSLVRGREWWRVVNVASSDHSLSGGESGESKQFLAEAADFLLRLIHGEGEHAEIFADLMVEQNVLRFKARTLVMLGYLPPAWLELENSADADLLKAIDRGLAYSQL